MKSGNVEKDDFCLGCVEFGTFRQRHLAGSWVYWEWAQKNDLGAMRVFYGRHTFGN